MSSGSFQTDQQQDESGDRHMSAMSELARFRVEVVSDESADAPPVAELWAPDREQAFQQAGEKLRELYVQAEGGYVDRTARGVDTDGETLWIDVSDGTRLTAYVEDVYAA